MRAARRLTPLRLSPERSRPLRLLPERSAPPGEALRIASIPARVISAKRNAGLDRSTCCIMSCAAARGAKRHVAAKGMIRRPRPSMRHAPLKLPKQRPTPGLADILVMDTLYIRSGSAGRLLQEPKTLFGGKARNAQGRARMYSATQIRFFL